MRPILPIMLICLLAPSLRAGEISFRLGVAAPTQDTPAFRGSGPSESHDVYPYSTILWAPASEGRTRFLANAGYTRRARDYFCSLGPCSYERVTADLVPALAGARFHVGDRSRRTLNAYIELTSGLTYARLQAKPVDLGPQFQAAPPITEHHLLLSSNVGLVVPIALSSSMSLELGTALFWTQTFHAGDAASIGDMLGFTSLSFQAGVGFR